MEAVVNYFTVWVKKMPCGTEQNHEKLQWRYLDSESRCETLSEADNDICTGHSETVL